MSLKPEVRSPNAGRRRSFSLDILALLPLAPWLLLGSLGGAVGAEASHNFARWEREIAAFEQSDHTNAPPKGGLLFIGSSSIRLWSTLARDFPGQPVINRGFGGSQIVDATHFADRIIFPYRPRAIYLRAGSNDIIAGKPPQQVFAEFKEFEAKVHAELPEAVLFYISLNPSPSRWGQADKEKALNEMIEQFARTAPRVKYIDAWSVSLGPDGKPRPELFRADRLHFNAAGYKLLAERVRPWVGKQGAGQ
ncbi:MAG TPA: GDSL-type esterase/lipase family protein [Candidatus Acidoferrum sp.]|nr:GDSL-type esterase/lipase family protein [Candidatus Acidoferrum sp.]